MRCWWIAMERRSCESYGLFKGQSLKFMHESIEQKPCAGARLVVFSGKLLMRGCSSLPVRSFYE